MPIQKFSLLKRFSTNTQTLGATQYSGENQPVFVVCKCQFGISSRLKIEPPSPKCPLMMMRIWCSLGTTPKQMMIFTYLSASSVPGGVCIVSLERIKIINVDSINSDFISSRSFSLLSSRSRSLPGFPLQNKQVPLTSTMYNSTLGVVSSGMISKLLFWSSLEPLEPFKAPRTDMRKYLNITSK